MAPGTRLAVQFVEVKPEELQLYWQWCVKRGCYDIRYDIEPNWLPEDMYAALRAGQVSCAVALYGDEVALGFVIYSKQLRIFNFVPELFIWAAWNLPMREWPPAVHMPTVIRKFWDYVANIAKTQYGASEISWMTRPRRARAFARKYGFKPTWVTMTQKV